MTGPTTEEKPAKNPKDDHDDDDDDEEDDEDYNPEQDKGKDGDEDDNNDDAMEDVVVEETSVLAPSQKKAVDEAFEKLFGYAWGTAFQLPRRRRRSTCTDTGDKNASLLVQVLGPVRAARVLQTDGSLQLRPRRKRQALAKWSKDTTTTSTTTATATQKQQYETKLFAGQKIQVAVAKPSSSASASNKPSAGIDNMLQQIAGPSKITTVAKTSADWDTFKTDTGLEAELEKKAQGKDAFLVKQDFLTRVDNRKFELERTERDRDRAKRGK